ncbi:Ig-like domain-containing domain [Tamlana sp. 2_MG-2023]|uniref:Ig-like domain-containing domain n=1 Tax=unclassified Tamlana TaxID=2614803 RepID=UPI0026E2CA9F|nr:MULTISPECIES: Ig-like domain-containing domain [unclassified Tamlana]MDO6760620.1 Ig-like domain-containing domain [Tamlana sp. 2_MG-2023]MDO6790876.1 Ig-like domain-containing domain [Tamlana sp. 1_MG-2023]
MKKTISNFVLALLVGAVFVNCANRGTPDGGPKDELPPIIIKSSPENYSTNFEGNEIEITFDEYIKIKDIQKQLIISPPMEYQPDITPLSAASKKVVIKINDTLAPNTTYAFNFGNSITDNNEGNPYPYYRYVFSTGSYIDSLKVTGSIVDAMKTKPETFINVGLYEVNTTFTDSIIFKEKPKYITNTLDSVTTFSIENVKPGKYLLVALKDGNGDNKFQQKTDQIAFHKNLIDVPTDTTYTLKLFNEEPDFTATRPKLLSGEKIAFGYEGDYRGMAIKIVSDTPEDFNYRITKDPKTDSLLYWYTPRMKVDSLLFKVTKPIDYEEDFTVRISEQKRDSIRLNVLSGSTIGLKEPFQITANTPITKFDASKISLIDKDSLDISFKTEFDTLNNTYDFDFEKTEDNSYKMQILPEAFTDIFDYKNDTIQVSVKTKKASDYGYVRFTLVNATYPIIIQLTDKDGKVKYENFITEEGPVDFLDLNPAIYLIRIIHDVNGNNKYDTGSYLEKRQPEKISHFPDVEIRADWGIEEMLEFK